jgi:hypothetical protein
LRRSNRPRRRHKRAKRPMKFQCIDGRAVMAKARKRRTVKAAPKRKPARKTSRKLATKSRRAKSPADDSFLDAFMKMFASPSSGARKKK